MLEGLVPHCARLDANVAATVSININPVDPPTVTNLFSWLVEKYPEIISSSGWRLLAAESC